jgi:hypothetical protein
MKRGALIVTTLYLAGCAALTVPTSLRAQGIIQIPGNRAAFRDAEAEAAFEEMIPIVERIAGRRFKEAPRMRLVTRDARRSSARGAGVCERGPAVSERGTSAEKSR